MVKIFPVKSIVPVSEADRAVTSKINPPNRFRSQSYDRPFGSDDCTKVTGQCKCHMCCDTPLVIAAGGSPMCDQFNITLRNVQEYLDGGLLQVHGEESLMIYCQEKGDGTCQVGVFCAINIEDYATGSLRAHENVTTKTDVTLLNKAKKVSQMHMDPVMLLYRESVKVNDIVQRIMAHDKPFQQLIQKVPKDCASLDVPCSHTLWEITNPEDIAALQAAFAEVGALYIADGHHRTAATYRESLRLTTGRAVNVANSARFLTALLFPDTHLSVLSYNRCIHRLPAGCTAEDVVAQIAEAFEVERLESPRPCTPPLSLRLMLERNVASTESPVSVSQRVARSRGGSTTTFFPIDCEDSLLLHRPDSYVAPQVPPAQHHLCMFLEGVWYSLRLRAHQLDGQDVLDGIGCNVLLEKILNPIFGMNNPGTDNYTIYVDGRDGAAGVERIVCTGDAAAGFLVCPLPPSEVMRVADAGLLLPAKATFFDPKPMSNILLRLLR